MNFSLFEKLRKKDQLKFVVKDQNDFDYAKAVIYKNKIQASIIFQPVYGENLKWLAEEVLSLNLGNIRILPQLHKLIWGEKRGV